MYIIAKLYLIELSRNCDSIYIESSSSIPTTPMPTMNPGTHHISYPSFNPSIKLNI